MSESERTRGLNKKKPLNKKPRGGDWAEVGLHHGLGGFRLKACDRPAPLRRPSGIFPVPHVGAPCPHPIQARRCNPLCLRSMVEERGVAYRSQFVGPYQRAWRTLRKIEAKPVNTPDEYQKPRRMRRPSAKSARSSMRARSRTGARSVACAHVVQMQLSSNEQHLRPSARDAN